MWNNASHEIDVVTANFSASSLPADQTLASAAFIGASCSEAACKTGLGFNMTSLQPNETLAIWLLCEADPSWGTSMMIWANYSMNVTEAASTDLSQGAVAGIVIACVVGFLFILGLIISFVKPGTFKRLFKCCQNQTHSVPDDSPRDKELERRETGLDAKADAIGHQPSNQVSIHPSPQKDGPRNPLAGLSDHENGGSHSLSGAANDLNATGQNLLSTGKEGPHDSHKGSVLPEINVDKASAAKGWKELDG